MNAIGTTEALELLNQRLQRPITRQLFSQSILPEMLRTGYAKHIGQTVVIDGEAWQGWWCGYIALREQKIAQGEWTMVHPYAAAEAEAYRDGDFDED